MNINDPWITTYLGRQFFITRATPADIYIEDIAHGLSNICRYVGQCRTFYSVAEHSVRMCEMAPVYLKLPVLLHDAPEAYLSDLSTMVKRCLPVYQEMENFLLCGIFSKYGIHGLQYDPAIKLLDEQIRTPEVLSLFPAHDGWTFSPSKKECDYGHINPWSHNKAERKFLNMFRRLHKGGV